MGLLDRIRSRVGSERQAYSYECTDCGAGFESAQANMAEVRCPECGARSVAARTDAA